MYIADDDTVSYGISELPEDAELIREDVLVLQQRDQAETDPAVLALVAETALNDLAGYLSLKEASRQAIDAGDRVQSRVLVAELRKTKSKLNTRYGGGSRLLATESASMILNPLMALESEVNDSDGERGFFGRMIDAIVNAFKWLWEKISSFFSSGDKKDKVSEVAEKVAADSEKIKEVETRVAKTGSKMDRSDKGIASTGLLSNFGFLGKDVKASDMVKNLEEMSKEAEKIRDIILKGCLVFRIVVIKTQDYGVEPTLSEEMLKRDTEHMFKDLETVLARLPAVDKATLLKNEVIDDRLVIKPGTTRDLSGFTAGSHFYSWVAEYAIKHNSDIKVEVPNASFHRPKEPVTADIIEPASSETADRISSILENIAKTHDRTQRNAESASKGNSDDTENLNRAMIALQHKSSHGQGASQNTVSNIVSTISVMGRSINAVMLAAIEAERNLVIGCKQYGEYVSLSLQSAKKAASEAEAPAAT